MSIKTLSPHYLGIPLTSPLTGTVCNSYELRIFIWEGSKTAVPAEPAYVMTKINAAGSSGPDKVNIARIVNDFIEFECLPKAQTLLADGNNQVWVKYVCYYDDQPATPALQEVQLAIKGYGYFTEGENPQLPANKILLTGDEFKVSRGGRFLLPIMVDEPAVPERVLMIEEYTRSSGINYKPTVTANFPYSEIAMFVRPVGAAEWIPAGNSVISTIPAGIAANVFEVMATAFDPVTSAVIQSNIYTITALKIYKVEKGDSSGYSVRVFYTMNINPSGVDLEVYGYGGAYWSSNPYDTNSPRYFSFSGGGNYILRMEANGCLSNEVPVTTPLTATINIP